MFLIIVFKYKRIEVSLYLTNKGKSTGIRNLSDLQVNTKMEAPCHRVWRCERRVGTSLDFPVQSSSMTGSVFVESAWIGVSMHLLHQRSIVEAQLTRKAFYFGPKKCTKLPNVHEALHVLIGAKMMQIGLREPAWLLGRAQEDWNILEYISTLTPELVPYIHTWHTCSCSDRSKQKHLHLQLLKYESPHHLNQKQS